MEEVTEYDEHEGHDYWQQGKIYDNPVEYTDWYHCDTCDKDFMMLSVTIIDIGGDES